MSPPTRASRGDALRHRQQQVRQHRNEPMPELIDVRLGEAELREIHTADVRHLWLGHHEVAQAVTLKDKGNRRSRNGTHHWAMTEPDKQNIELEHPAQRAFEVVL